MFKSFTDIGHAVDFTFGFILIISVVMMTLITVLMVTFVVKYHRKRHPKPAQVHSHAILEVVWTVVPTLLALGMFYYGWLGYRLMHTPPPGAMEVKAIGRMWSWQFEYGNGKQATELYVPVGKPVKVNIESKDVIHSLYLPAFKVKQDAVPGLKTFLWFQPKELGEYNLFCAEYCGQRHSYMRSKVVVVPQADFDKWVQEGVEEVKISKEMPAAEREAALVREGKRLTEIKGCIACHTTDGTKLVGPTYKGLFGRTEHVVTDGQKREIVVDEAYVRKSILDPKADIVDGFQPLMPSQRGLMTDDEIDAVIAYLKTL